jgi:low affinity Fe/Cu permease
MANEHNWKFSSFARTLSIWTGRPPVFAAAIIFIIVWGITGPIFHYSDTWQLVVNTTTSIITFLVVFLIQNSQNRDTEAIQLKLDELIRATQGAHNALLSLEKLDEKTVAKYRERYSVLAELSREKVESGKQDIDSPEVKKE